MKDILQDKKASRKMETIMNNNKTNRSDNTACYAKLEQVEEGVVVSDVTKEEDRRQESEMEMTLSAAANSSTTMTGMMTLPNPPVGCSEGGVWGTQTYCGSHTQWTACGCCICCGLIPASIVCYNPFDQRKAYMVNGHVYDVSGKRVQSSGFELKKFDGRSVNTEQRDTSLLISGVIAGFMFVAMLVYQLWITESQ